MIIIRPYITVARHLMCIMLLLCEHAICAPHGHKLYEICTYTQYTKLVHFVIIQNTKIWHRLYH